MTLRVSTTGSSVVLTDLGIEVIHPTVSRDLSLEFTAIELRDSADLTSAIQAGNLDVDDGTHFVHQDDYDPDELLIQELGYNRDELYISHDELASVNDILINKTGVFPLSLNSTASSTRNVYSAAARFITWQLAVDDIVSISGSTTADGTYTVESITDQQNFIVVESIADSTGGTTNIYHPGGASKIGVVDDNFNTISGLNLQEALDSIDDKLGSGGFSDELVKVSNNDTTAGYLNGKLVAGTGITLTEINDGADETFVLDVTASTSGIDEGEHRSLDQLVHLIAEDSYDEFIKTNGKVTQIITWTDSGKSTKIREQTFTYTSGKISQILTIQYDQLGVEVERITEDLTRSGNHITSIERTLVIS